MGNLRQKKVYLEYCRCVAIVLVVAIHVVAIPIQNWAETCVESPIPYSVVYSLGCLGVPLFLMISGALLLRPEYKVSNSKLFKHSIPRLLLPLFIFGTGYAALEIFFEERSINVAILPKAIFRVLNQQSWRHLWYLYMLIGIYILLPIIRWFVHEAPADIKKYAAIVIIVFGYLVPTWNSMFAMNLGLNVPVPLCHIAAFIAGYYLDSLADKKRIRLISFFGLGSLVILIIAATIEGVVDVSKYELLARYDDIFILLATCWLFVSIKSLTSARDIKVMANLGGCTFGIYLIHPVIMNVMYKVVNIQPILYNSWIAIPVFILIFTVPTWLVVNVIKRIPYINKLV